MEHLGISDTAIVKIRRLLLQTLKDHAAGKPLPGSDPKSWRVRSARYKAPAGRVVRGDDGAPRARRGAGAGGISHLAVWKLALLLRRRVLSFPLCPETGGKFEALVHAAKAKSRHGPFRMFAKVM